MQRAPADVQELGLRQLLVNTGRGPLEPRQFELLGSRKDAGDIPNFLLRRARTHPQSRRRDREDTRSGIAAPSPCAPSPPRRTACLALLRRPERAGRSSAGRRLSRGIWRSGAQLSRRGSDRARWFLGARASVGSLGVFSEFVMDGGGSDRSLADRHADLVETADDVPRGEETGD